jgi:uncharacterized protein (TIGR02118 family)
LTEKLAIVLRAAVPVESLVALSEAVSRAEVDVAVSYPESDRYPGRDGVTAAMLLTVTAVNAMLVESAVEACGRSAVIAAYRLEERQQWDYNRTWTGTRTPGMKQVSFISRAPGITRTAFATHWRDVHAKLAAKHHPSIWRYVQNVLIEPLTPDAPSIDGIAELSYRSYEDWRDRKYDSLEGQAIVAADVATFMDAQASWHLLGHEHVL